MSKLSHSSDYLEQHPDNSPRDDVPLAETHTAWPTIIATINECGLAVEARVKLKALFGKALLEARAAPAAPVDLSAVEAAMYDLEGAVCGYREFMIHERKVKLDNARAALLSLYRTALSGVPANTQAIRDKAFCEVVNILRTQFIEGSPMGRQYENAAQTVRGLLGKSTAEIDAILAERPASGVTAKEAGETNNG